MMKNKLLTRKMVNIFIQTCAKAKLPSLCSICCVLPVQILLMLALKLRTDLDQRYLGNLISKDDFFLAAW